MIVHGNGSIQPLESKPKYKCRKWRLYVSTECGQKTRVVHGTWTEARNAIEAFKAELAEQVPPAQELAAYMASWLAYRENLGTLAPGTIANNKREIAAIMRSPLSTFPLDEITPTDCKNALLWIKHHPARKSGELSNTTMNKIFITLASIFAQAVDDELIPRSPMARIRAPKPDTKERRALTPDELMAFVHSLSDLPLDGRVMALYMISLLGLRRAEACALYDSDVDGKSVHVLRAVKERDGTIAEPKSAASKRVLPIPPLLTAKVDEWRLNRPTSALTLCCNTRGGVLRPQLLQRWWTGDANHHGIRDELGASGITLHQLRHSNLSMMARHLSPYDLQRYAGWSSIEPAKVYVHSDLSQLERAISEVYDTRPLAF